MHEVLEIIMPQVDDVEEAVNKIMLPFNEIQNDEDIDYMGNGFYDWYVIGGRWAGHKMQSMLDPEKLNAFYEELKERKVTVSGLQCGKQELDPPSQIPMVDELFASYFPQYTGKACPLFNHSNNQYINNCLYGDVMPLRDISDKLTAARLIIAGSDLQANYMLSKDIWNGCNFEETTWSGVITEGVEMYKEKVSSYRPDYQEKHTPKDDWLVVTVDYHS